MIPRNLSEGSQLPITRSEAVTIKVKGFVTHCPGTLKNSYQCWLCFVPKYLILRNPTGDNKVKITLLLVNISKRKKTVNTALDFLNCMCGLHKLGQKDEAFS